MYRPHGSRHYLKTTVRVMQTTANELLNELSNVKSILIYCSHDLNSKVNRIKREERKNQLYNDSELHRII